MSGCGILRSSNLIGLRRFAEQPADEPHDVLHVATDVVEHHGHEQQSDDQQPALEDALARLSAERAALDRLEHVEKYLPAVENRDRKQIEDRDVDADERDE